MKLRDLIGERFKEKPADATVVSQIFLLRGGYIKHVANGIYTLTMPAKRIIAKVENIVREEMDKLGGQEVLMPVVLPRELWEESGRYQSAGKELLRFKDRGGREMLLAMTHEEAAVAMARDEATSYARYPFMIYQIQTKFRDEPRCKGGLIRVREFTMKDAYSFHTSQECLSKFYEKCKQAYFNIFRRIGFEVVAVGSDTGMMGGSVAHEFMLLSDAGEDSIAMCDACGYMDNVEVARTEIKNEGQDSPLKEIHTPGVKEIAELEKFTGLPAYRMIKACAFAVEGSQKPCVAFIRGDYEVNEAKLRKALRKNVFPLAEGDECGLVIGFIGPIGLNRGDAIVLFDESLKGCKGMVCGANRKDYHHMGASCGRDFSPESFYDLYKVREGDSCPKCGAKLAIRKGIEVGNIFQLGTKYTESMRMTYLDENGERKVPIMGCYGIGIGRAMASAVEANHDDYGPIWPFAIAPWHIHICALGGNAGMKKFADEFYEKLLGKGYEVIYDDREVSAGVQFSDADLLGVPYRVIFGAKNYEKGLAEIASRDKKFKKLVPLAGLEAEIEAIIAEEKAKL